VLLPKLLNYLSFQSFDFSRAYLMKVISETLCAHSIWYPRCYLICLPHLLTLGLLKTQHDSWINNLFINQYVCVFLNSLKLIPILMKFVVKGVLSISVEISTLWQNTCLSIYTITLSHKSYNILSYSMLF
jgi:hypothetical protein